MISGFVVVQDLVFQILNSNEAFYEPASAAAVISLESDARERHEQRNARFTD